MAPRPDPVWLKAYGELTSGEFKGPTHPPGDIAGRREEIRSFFTWSKGNMADIHDVSTKDFYTTAKDGHEILLRWFTKNDTDVASSPAVLYLHGGGLIAQSINDYDKILRTYASSTSVPLLAVEYRLAPEHPYPTPVEDCYAGLVWLHDNAKKLGGISTSAIGVMGDSAGGNLTAGVSILARDRKGPRIAKQILQFPMLDDRNLDSTFSRDDKYGTWDHAANNDGWSSYLGPLFKTDNVPEAAAPARIVDATDMPDLYADCGELDIFCSETIDYVHKHTKAGVPTEFRITPGVPHAYELVAPTSEAAVRSIADRFRVIEGLRSYVK